MENYFFYDIINLNRGEVIMLFYILIILILIIIIYSFVIYNKFIKLNNLVDEAFSTMDVYLKKRWDLIPNLVKIVSGYKDHEENTLKEIINIRNNSYDNLSNEEKIKKNIKLEKNIILLKEAYPNILASDNFNKLSEELVNIEKDIENSRKYYNGTVRIYNNKVEMFPSNIFAKLYGYKSILMFETKDRENIKIDL